MPRRLFDSEFIFGLHDPGGEQLMLAAGRPGWVLFTEELGRNPADFSGRDYQPYSNRNLGVIVRLNHGYYPDGTVPLSQHYADFAQRCANFVANSRGCKIWIIGNEMNHAIERPQIFSQALPPALMPQGAESGVGPEAKALPLGDQVRSAFGRFTQAFLRTISGGMGSAQLYIEPQPGPPPAASSAPTTTDADPFGHGASSRFSALAVEQPDRVRAAAEPQRASASAELITPELYARCYRLCRNAIHAIPGHADDQVLVGAVAPWNNQTIYPGNPNGDWVQYLQDTLQLVGADGCDGLALHTYTHGSDPSLITAEQGMDPPFAQRRYHFRAYQDFMAAIPTAMRHLPVYLTETDQDDPWLDSNNGWVQAAYAEINRWNQQPGNQQIRALILYRWPNLDRWAIETKPGVIDDFRLALTNDYRWRGNALSAQGINLGDVVETLDVVNLRRTPGFVGKSGIDVLSQLPAGSRLTIRDSSSRQADQLTWWQVRTASGSEGWVAEVGPNGSLLLTLVTRATPEEVEPPLNGKFRPGDQVVTRDVVRLRQTPGYQAKPASDIIADIPTGRQGTVLGGPRRADGLVWWQVATTTSVGTAVNGWMAESAPDGAALLEKAAVPPPVVGTFALGELAVTRTAVNVRRTPGLTNKPANDLLAAFEPRTTLNILAGPQAVDGLDWWRVGGITLSSGEVTGWVAERAPSGEQLLGRAPKLPGTNIPDRATGSYLAAPFQGSFGIGQLWGENPQIYGRISYDGVPLKGHNGIDFLTPNGTNLVAVDDGTVLEAAPNDPSGLGNYIKLGHSWGESLYAHLQDFSVQPGQTVRRGQVLGRSDNSGFSSGPHLHFAIRINPYNRRDGWGGYADPLPYLNPADVQLPTYVRDPLPTGVLRPQASPAPPAPRRPLAEAPGYAPDRPGLKRP